MAHDEMILKTLARILIFSSAPLPQRNHGGTYRACLETFLCPGVRDNMLSLYGLQSAYVVYFSTILRAYKLMLLLAKQEKS